MRSALVGRDAELGALRSARDEAFGGCPRTVVLQGPAGMGKTALLARFLDEERDAQVLHSSGDEAEADLAYAAVAQLARTAPVPLPARLDEPLGREVLAEPFAVGAGLLELFNALQEHGALTVVVDDAHWADRASLQALVFALRRLHSDRILTVVSVRDELASNVPEGLRRLVDSERGVRVCLGGLDARAIRDLAVTVGAGELSATAAQSLRDHTGGNPLYVRSLLAELPQAALAETQLPLPAPRAFALSVLARLSGCSAPTRRLVVAASVLGVRGRLDVAAALAEVDDRLAALEEAEGAGLLGHDFAGERRFVFTHPLVRAAVYHDIGPVQRGALHRRAAELLTDEGGRLRHRVLAASGVDAALAEEVAGSAYGELSRAGWNRAATMLRSAAQLHPDPSQAERYLLDALECMVLAGDVVQAAAYRATAESAADQARGQHLLGFLDLAGGRLSDAERHLSAAWAGARPGDDPALAARIAEKLGFVHAQTGRGDAGADWARRSLELSHPGGAPFSSLALCVSLAIAGRPREAMSSAEDLLEQARSGGGVDLGAVIGRGNACWSSDLLTAARKDLEWVVAARHQTPLQVFLIALTSLSSVEYLLGDWDESLAHAAWGVTIAEDAGQGWASVLLHAMAISPLAGRGEWDRAEGHARSATPIVEDDMAVLAYTSAAKAFLAYARGDVAAVIGLLEPLRHVEHRDGTHEPGVVRWHDLLADAYTATGRFEEADAVLQEYEATAQARNRHSALANAGRARGRLEAARGAAEAAEAAFAGASASAEKVEIPFDRALVELDYGAFLRRQGARRRAVARLRAAHAGFEALGARPFLDRCDRELAASGLTPMKRRESPSARLSPQELAVARLVASGLTNREVAAELVVSVKTVEYHLGNVFLKLDIRSRRHMAAALAPTEP